MKFGSELKVEVGKAFFGAYKDYLMILTVDSKKVSHCNIHNFQGVILS